MENLIELPTTAQPPSLLSLNRYCLLELFDFLKFEDSINLAETCICLSDVANRTFRKYSRMMLDRRMDKKREEFAYRFLTHFGHHVLSLTIDLSFRPLHWRIIKNCENLKRLQLHCEVGDFENDPFPIDNLEVLSFSWCDSKWTKSFLNIVRKVKVLSIYECRIECNALKQVFRNSPDMESFKWWYNGNGRFDFNLLEMISNVETLCLQFRLNNVTELDPLLRLNRLSKLQLYCEKNITSFLSKLAKKGIIRELELLDVAFDQNFFEMLKSFYTLELLVICVDYSSWITGHFDDEVSINELKASVVGPPKLKHFRLSGFIFTLDAFLSMIKPLKYLESICFYQCFIAPSEERNFNDMTKLSQHILLAIDDCDRKQRLDVALPSSVMVHSSEEYLFDSERLRIHNKRRGYKRKLEISINFPEF